MACIRTNSILSGRTVQVGEQLFYIYVTWGVRNNAHTNLTGSLLQVPRRCVVVRASSADVPPNVLEAREWIARWRARQAAEGNGAAAPAAAPQASAKPSKSSKPAAAPSQWGSVKPDGTIVFTSTQLKDAKTSQDAADALKSKGKK